jgi:hypothetical protein
MLCFTRPGAPINGWLDARMDHGRLGHGRFGPRLSHDGWHFTRFPPWANFQLADDALDTRTTTGNLFDCRLLLVAGHGTSQPRRAVLVLYAHPVILEQATVFHVLGNILCHFSVLPRIG